MLGIVTPVWQRPDLTRRVLAQWAGPAFDFTYHVVVRSPEDPCEQHVPESMHTVWAPNSDFQRKWQAGMDAMPPEVDAIMMMGSDDVATPDLVREIYEAALEDGMAYPGSAYFAHPATRRAFHAFYRLVYAGCTYRMDLAKSTENPLFVRPEDPTMPPDVCTLYNVRRNWWKPGHRVSQCGGSRIIMDIKSDTNVWSYDKMFQRANRKATTLDAVSYDDLFSIHFPGFWDEQPAELCTG